MEIHKKEKYSKTIESLQAFYSKYNKKTHKLNSISKYTSICSVLKQNFPDFHFVGFYLVVDLIDLNDKKTLEKALEIGPYQSTILATPRIGYGKGVCGTCWEQKKTIIENDVTICKNYIACDGETLSEIVVPVWEGEEVVAVLDIDCNEKNKFDELDIKYLEEIVKLN